DLYKLFSVEVLNISTEPYNSICLKFRNTLFTFVINCVYRPPSGSNTNSAENDLEFNTTLDSCFKDLPNLIIVGDFNYTNICWKGNSYTGLNKSDIDFIATLNNNNISQLITEPTRFRGTDRPFTLDLLLVE